MVAIDKAQTEEDIKKEESLEECANELVEENNDDIELMQGDRKSMFWVVKKKLTSQYGIILDFEDRYNEIAHQILEKSWKKGLREYEVSENRVKNVIFNAIESYLNSFEGIEDEVLKKIDNYKRKLVAGSQESDLVFERLYEEELRRKGMLI